MKRQHWMGGVAVLAIVLSTISLVRNIFRGPPKPDWSIAEGAGRWAAQEAAKRLPANAEICLLAPANCGQYLNLEIEHFTKTATQAGLRIADSRSYNLQLRDGERQMMLAYEQMCVAQSNAAAVVAFLYLPKPDAASAGANQLKLIGVDIGEVAALDSLMEQGLLWFAIAPKPTNEPGKNRFRLILPP